MIQNSPLYITDPDALNSKMKVAIDEDIKAMIYRFNSIIESIYIDVDDGTVSFYHGSQQFNPSFSYDHYFTDFSGSKESFYWTNMH